MFLVLVSVFSFTRGVNAVSSNEVTLHFVTDIYGVTITTGYAEYPDVGKIELYKDDTLVTDLFDNMKNNLNSVNYKLKITSYSDSNVLTMKVRLNINNRYYSTLDKYFLFDTI